MRACGCSRVFLIVFPTECAAVYVDVPWRSGRMQVGGDMRGWKVNAQKFKRFHQGLTGRYFFYRRTIAERLYHITACESLLSDSKSRTMTTASMMTLLPGEDIPQDQLPRFKKGSLTLGPGLRHVPPSGVTSITHGSLHIDHRKSALWLDSPHGRHLPSVGDLVVAQVHHTAADHFHCILTPHTPFALLGLLAFEGANRKTRPQLRSGDLVYARVSRASKWEDVEVECVTSSSGKADGLGVLKGGMVFDISPAFARRLMMGTDKEGRSKGGIVILEEVGQKIKFEVAVGRNGRVWVDGETIGVTITIGRLLTQCDAEGWELEAQKKNVRKALREV